MSLTFGPVCSLIASNSISPEFHFQITEKRHTNPYHGPSNHSLCPEAPRILLLSLMNNQPSNLPRSQSLSIPILTCSSLSLSPLFKSPIGCHIASITALPTRQLQNLRNLARHFCLR